MPLLTWRLIIISGFCVSNISLIQSFISSFIYAEEEIASPIRFWYIVHKIVEESLVKREY